MHAASQPGTAARARLHDLVIAALPPLGTRARAAVALLVDTHDLGWSAEGVAQRLGFANRHGLARLLEQEGLPPYRHLTHWIMILGWVLEWEARRTPLFQQAGSCDRWPRACRRVLRTRTGLNWAEVRERGAMWVAAQLAAACVPPPARDGAQGAAAPPEAAQPLPGELRAG